MRSGDHDRFLSVLFAAEQDRENLFALYAFHLEIARIRGQVSEPLLGEIRLQWWREGIEAIYNGQPVRGHPVLQPLERAIRECSLPRQPVDALIDAYSADLAATPPVSMADLEHRIGAASAGLMRLAALSAGGEALPDQALRHAAMAWGLAGVLRNIGFHASQRQIFLPGDVMRAEALTMESVLGGRDSPELRRVIMAVAQQAKGHLAAARIGLPAPSRRLMPVLLPAALTQLYLRQIAQADYDPFVLHPPLPAFRRQIRMAWAMGWRRI